MEPSLVLHVPSADDPSPPLSLRWVPVSCPQRCHCGAHEDRLQLETCQQLRIAGAWSEKTGWIELLYIPFPVLAALCHGMCSQVSMAAEFIGGVQFLCELPASEAAALPALSQHQLTHRVHVSLLFWLQHWSGLQSQLWSGGNLVHWFSGHFCDAIKIGCAHFYQVHQVVQQSISFFWIPHAVTYYVSTLASWKYWILSNLRYYLPLNSM